MGHAPDSPERLRARALEHIGEQNTPAGRLAAAEWAYDAGYLTWREYFNVCNGAPVDAGGEA